MSFPRRRIEGSEELIFGENVGICQDIEEAGLSGVRVPDDGGPWDIDAFPAAVLYITRLPHVLELFLNFVNPELNRPSIQLDLLLAGTLCAVAATALPGKVFVGVGQTRQGEPKLGKFDLETGLPRQSARGEDFDDQFGSIVDRLARKRLPISLLGGRKRVVENYGIHTLGLGHSRNFIGLAGSDKEASCFFPQFHVHRGDNLDTECLREAREFVKKAGRFFLFYRFDFDADEKGLFSLGTGVVWFVHNVPAGRIVAHRERELQGRKPPVHTPRVEPPFMDLHPGEKISEILFFLWSPEDFGEGAEPWIEHVFGLPPKIKKFAP